jgi:predicted RND superfamily exporter protein
VLDAPAPAADRSLHLVVRLRWVVVLAFALLAAWWIPGVQRLRHDDDVLAFLPPDHPDVVSFREVADRFGMLEVGLVGLRATDGGDLLVPERTESVRAIAKSVSELPGVRLVLDYPSFPDVRVVGDTLAVDPLVPKGLDAPAIRERVLGSRDAVGNLVSKDGTAAVLLVYLLPAGDESSSRSERLDAIRDTVTGAWDGEVYFGGGPFIEDNAARSSRTDIERLSPIVIAVLTLTSALLLRSLAAALANLVVTGLGVAMVVGAHGVFGEPLSVVSSTTPVLMVALGGAFGMHLIAGFQRQSGSAPARASASLRELWLAVVLSAATTAVSFFALVVMPQVPMQRFGIAAGLGVLLLLAMALLLVPAMLAFMPKWALRHRPVTNVPMPVRPPLGLLLVVAAIGLGLGLQLRADPDTRNLFDPDSEPAQADAFFNDRFGGSQYLQIGVLADVREPVVLRAIRDLADEIRPVPGVADVRTLVDPVQTLTEGFGGRRGVPQTAGQAQRVLGNLADHPAMAQLLVPDLTGAIVHVKLAPMDGDALAVATATIRDIVARAPAGPLFVAPRTDPETQSVQREAVRRRLEGVLDRELSMTELESLIAGAAAESAMADEAIRVRDRALTTDEVIEPAPAAEVETVDPAELLRLRGPPLVEYLRSKLPTVVARDPEGIGYVATQVEGWLAEARASVRITATCKALGLANADENATADDEAAKEAARMAELGLAPEPEAPAAPAGPCRRFADAFSEVDDEEWGVPARTDATLREIPWALQLTGQPIIGQAFAQSVTKSLWRSTAVSIVALTLVLVVGGHLRALVPALWTLLVTAGIVQLLGHPIGIGTSMVTCIAVGAGVDFAIHLSVRARASTGPDPGREAADELGGVVLVTGLQLAAAFLVLLASVMPPLRQFGVGLAIGLLCAAAGAVWFAPALFRRRRASAADRTES